MGRPESMTQPPVAPPCSGRPRAHGALRTVLLSALAGGGLTAAGLGGAAAQSRSRAGQRASAEGRPAAAASRPRGRKATGTTGPRRNEHHADHHEHHPHDHQHDAVAHHARPRRPRPRPRAPPAPKHRRARKRPSVVLKRKQKSSAGAKDKSPARNGANAKEAGEKASAQQRRRLAPVGRRHGALEAILNSCNASAAGPGFYRMPLFLLPIYKAAAVQYGVPWQILAAINEIETDYGTDLSVSSAGAVGWMQFMPGTWLQYGVDALDAGYADPYNPVDAIFAAARYLRAAGAAEQPQGRDPRLQPLRRICELGAAAGEADHDLPAPRDRDPHRPDRRPPAGHRQAALVDHPGRQLVEQPRARPRAPPRRAPKAPPRRRARRPPAPRASAARRPPGSTAPPTPAAAAAGSGSSARCS